MHQVRWPLRTPRDFRAGLLAAKRRKNVATAARSASASGLLPNVDGWTQTGIVVDFYPLLRGGDDAPFKKMERYLTNGAERGGQTTPEPKQVFDLPRRAELLRLRSII